MTLYFVIVKINENKGLFHYEKSVEVVRGVDNNLWTDFIL